MLITSLTGSTAVSCISQCCLLLVCLFELALLSFLGSMYTVCRAESLSVGQVWFTAAGLIRDSGRSGHTLTWPLSQDPYEWSQRPGLPPLEGNGGSRGASRSLYPTPAWLRPSASCKTARQTFYWSVEYLTIKLRSTHHCPQDNSQMKLHRTNAFNICLQNKKGH